MGEVAIFLPQRRLVSIMADGSLLVIQNMKSNFRDFKPLFVDFELIAQIEGVFEELVL